ncbi:MAG: hypothetical protein V2B20_06095 [Pseudomonadota bacterium]
MSISQDQLSEIFRQLRESFLSHPAISIIPMKGDPPEQYEIIYKISGFNKSGKEDAKLATDHRIELTIPFGFPHFPPSCKPKSDIYHPDFDPAAICLGDFWQQHSQVADLIIFIGKLINGESYSTSNAFNEEAAAWYQSHSDAFPIADIKWGNIDNKTTESPENSIRQIDTIDDDDLSPDFNLLSLESSTAAIEPVSNTFAPALNVHSELDFVLLQHLESEKMFFKIRQILGNNPNVSDQGRIISAHCEGQITKAQELYSSAERAEKVENFKNAFRLYEEVGTITADFPSLEESKLRVSQSLAIIKEESKNDFTDLKELLSFVEPEGEPTRPGPPQKRTNKSKAQLLPAKEEGSLGVKERLRNKAVAGKTDNSFYRRLGLYILSGALCTVGLGCGLYYFVSIHRFDNATTSFKQCSAFFSNGHFAEAKLSCNSALDSLSGIKFMLQTPIKELQGSIQEILVSEQLVQGLAGNILVDGKYLNKKDAAFVSSYKQLLKEGEEFFNQENWTQAENRFSKVLTITEKSTLISPTTVDEIKSKLSFTRFSKVFSSASTFLAQKKWQEAATEIKKAKAQLESLPEQDRQKYAIELSSALAKCNFEEFRRQGDDFFSKEDWLNAISTYKSVLPTIEEGKVAPQKDIDALRANISRAELYATIDMGNKAFISGSWNEAIQQYNKAVSFLNANQGALSSADAQATRKKIDKIILQTTIIRDRQIATTQQEDKKDLTAARNTYRQIIANINKSGFADEEEFLETKKISIATVQELDEKIYQADKEKYLKDNFRTLFSANYPTAIPEHLNNPIISYVKAVDGKMIFKMQCTETGQGRPLSLVMFYAYDKASNHWAFFSEHQ